MSTRESSTPPYGETWIEKTSNTGLEYQPYRFTGKEIDEETGLYYYGARYLDPRYSRWISTDPALGEYIPQAPINDEAKKSNQKVSLHLISSPDSQNYNLPGYTF